MESDIERFMVKVNKTDTCWRWVGASEKSGYGGFWFGSKTIKAHRASFILFKGAVPVGLQIDHLCRNRWCVNPGHLEAVTPKENTMRGISPSAKNAMKTHCSRGHEYTAETTRLTRGGRSRTCRICDTILWKKQERKRQIIRMMERKRWKGEV